MGYFDFKINSIYIENNRELWSKAEIQMFSLIVANNSVGDIFGDLLNTSDESKKLDLFKTATKEILSQKQIVTLENIKDKRRVNFGMNGYSLYRSNNTPEYFDWSFAIFESDKDIREFGSKLNNIINLASYNQFATNLLLTLGTTMTPQLVAAAKITEFVGKIVASEMMANKDDQLCVYCESFNRHENYPNLILRGHDIEDLSGNCKISYSIFGKE